MTIYYKATRLSGTDFHSGTVDYAGALESGKRVRVTTITRTTYSCCSDSVLHASDVPAETLGAGSWPCRLFEASGRPVAREGHKRGFRSLQMVREIEAWQALGLNGREVMALIDRAGRLTTDELHQLDAQRGTAWSRAGRAVGFTAGRTARCVVGDAAVDAIVALGDTTGVTVWHTADALAVRDLIAPEQYDTLTMPWRTTIGRIHPDDREV